VDVLYISYDGALDPLGCSQVVPYVEGLAARGHQFDLVTFEKRHRWGDDEQLREMAERLAKAGVRWHPLRYHKRLPPVATALDLARGYAAVLRLARRRHFDLIHARSYPSTLLAWRLSRRCGAPYVFDMRGLYADERVDGNLWPSDGLLYRTTKQLERRFLRDAAAVVTLTWASEPVVRSLVRETGGVATIDVIPTSVDLQRFSPVGAAEVPTLVYLGSVGTWYLLAEMLAFARVFIERANGRLRLLINGGVEMVQSAIERAGIDSGRVSVESVPYADVPAAMNGASATFAFIKPAPSKVASAATKVSESLALGLPVAVNRGVGDAAEIVERENVGVVVDPYDPSSYPEAVARLIALAEEPDIRRRCRTVAERRFDLASAVSRYDRLYAGVVEARQKAATRRIVVLCPHPPDRAPGQRLKFEQYYPSWRAAGYEVDVRPFWSPAASEHLYEPGQWGRKVAGVAGGFLRRVGDGRDALRADLVYLFLEALPLGPPILERMLVRRGVPLVYDIDDLVYLPHSSGQNPFMRWLRDYGKVHELMGLANHVIVCTAHLQAVAAGYNKHVTRISSTIDLDLYQPRPHRPRTEGLVIGWSGSHSTSPYLHLLDSVLAELQRTEGIRVKVIGDGAFRIPGVEIKAMPWRLETEVAELSEIDIGVYPLPDEEWVLGKSGLKALQYMALGIPTVAQSVGTNLEIIDDGVNGLLAGDAKEWAQALRLLIRDPELRARLGDAGRRTVAAHYSVAVTRPEYLGVLDEVLSRAREPREPNGRDS
jgi:glycosyltransferase involved in cell wall biosynthesis